MAGFFAGAFFVADFDLTTFFVAAGFFVPVDGFFGVVAFLTFGLATFFVPVFFVPAGLAALVFLAFAKRKSKFRNENKKKQDVFYLVLFFLLLLLLLVLHLFLV